MKIYLLIFISIVILSGCGVKKEKDFTSEYKKMEEDFIKAAETFVGDNPSLLPANNEIYSISLTNLYSSNHLKKLIDPKTKKDCNKEDSYIHVKKVNDNVTYTVYLECGDYTTK